MLTTAKAGRTRATVSFIASTVFAASLGWPALAEAEPEPGDDAGIASERGNAEPRDAVPEAQQDATREQSVTALGTPPAQLSVSLPMLQLGDAPFRQVSKFELSYPEREALIVERKPLGATTLHLDRPSNRIATDAPLTPERDKYRRRSLFDWEQPAEPRPRLSPLWPAIEIEPTTISMLRAHPSTPQDERSAWARFHSSLWGASATVGTAMITTVALLSLLPKDFTSWNKPNFYGLKRTFSQGPSFDYDNFFFNYIAHPIDGSEFFLIARNRKLTFWESFAYAAAVSSFFEFFIESAYEGASWQDLWITPVSGTVIGELRWQAKKSLENPRTGKPSGTANKILYVIIDPVDAILNL